MIYSANLITRKIIPEIQEFPMLSLSSRVTPENLFFIRNHFPYPIVNMRTWVLSIQGCVDRPLNIHYQDLLNMPQVTLPVTLECAGNKRAFFDPKTRGEQWELGAMSHAEWTGVRLVDILQLAGVQSHAIEVAFEGMDKGVRTDMPGEVSYIRSLPLAKAMHPDTLIALCMNGKPLPFQHGYPARLIVPGWYGMASVKWLHHIALLEEPFQGPFQVVDYVYNCGQLVQPFSEPVTTNHLNATIARPTHQEVLGQGIHWVIGTAFSGGAPVDLVEISLDNGKSWQRTTWIDPEEPYSWRRWCWKWTAVDAGTYDLKARAIDVAGNRQSEFANWNVKGYGYNAIQHIRVYVDG